MAKYFANSWSSLIAALPAQGEGTDTLPGGRHVPQLSPLCDILRRSRGKNRKRSMIAISAWVFAVCGVGRRAYRRVQGGFSEESRCPAPGPLKSHGLPPLGLPARSGGQSQAQPNRVILCFPVFAVCTNRPATGGFTSGCTDARVGSKFRKKPFRHAAWLRAGSSLVCTPHG